MAARSTNTRVAYERDYVAFGPSGNGAQPAATVGLGDFAASLSGSPRDAPAHALADQSVSHHRLQAGGTRFNVGAALGLANVVLRRAERRLDELDLSGCSLPSKTSRAIASAHSRA